MRHMGQGGDMPVGELPYLLTMGPHNFLWFRLMAPDQAKQYSGTGGL